MLFKKFFIKIYHLKKVLHRFLKIFFYKLILKIFFYNLIRISWVRNFLILFFFKKEIFIKEKKDIVFVLFYPTGCLRLGYLLNKLKQRGLEVECISKDLNQAKDILKFSFDHMFLFQLFLIFFAIEKYNPFLLVVQNDAIPKEIKIYVNSKKAKLVNIAHGVSFSNELFSSLNYDYYFVFGKKSYQNLLNNKYIKFINKDCKFVFAGSPFFQRESILNWEQRNFILIAGSYFPKGFYSQDDYKYFVKFYESLNFLISKFPGYIFLFKPHIRREIELEYKYILFHNNLIVLDASESIYKILRYCKLLISDVSVSTIESAAAGCPFIIFDWLYNKNKEYTVSNELGDMEFFERATNKEELEELFKKRVSRDFFINSQEKLYSYYKLHIEVENSIDYIADYLKNIIDNIKGKT